jgi:hypothetical protein
MMELLKKIENIEGLNISKHKHSLSIRKVKKAYSKDNKIRIYFNENETFDFLVKVNNDYIEFLNITDIDFIINYIDRI